MALNKKEKKYKSKRPLKGVKVKVSFKDRLFNGFLDNHYLFGFLLVFPLVVGNIVYTGGSWYHRLHLYKWWLVMIPIGVAFLIKALKFVLYRNQFDEEFKLDLFGVIYFLLLVYVSLQPLFVKIINPYTYINNLIFFTIMYSAYLLYFNYFKENMLIYACWILQITAVISVVFAELQIRGMAKGSELIMNVSGYLANTGQQNMFGLFLAIALMCGLYLHLIHLKQRVKAFKLWFNLLLMVICFYGLFMTTSRSAAIAFVAGLFVFIPLAVYSLTGSVRKNFLKQVGVVAVVFVLMIAVMLLLGGGAHRIGAAITKWKQLTTGVIESIKLSGRLSIWATSITMFLMYPIFGVGLGNFKWHYLESQAEMFKRYGLEWRYTHWAHNEFLQWMCETGIIGSILLFGYFIYWFFMLLKHMFTKKDLTVTASFGVSVVILFGVNALFTRPFHRIEDAVWFCLALALVNKEVMPAISWDKVKLLKRISVAFVSAIILFGGYIVVDSIPGEKALYKAIVTPNVQLKLKYFDEAEKHIFTKDDVLKEKAKLYHTLYKKTGDLKYLKEALSCYEKLFNVRPTPLVAARLAEYYARLGNIKEAQRYASYFPESMRNKRFPFNKKVNIQKPTKVYTLKDLPPDIRKKLLEAIKNSRKKLQSPKSDKDKNNK